MEKRENGGRGTSPRFLFTIWKKNSVKLNRLRIEKKAVISDS
jgi:hypothetical protein